MAFMSSRCMPKCVRGRQNRCKRTSLFCFPSLIIHRDFLLLFFSCDNRSGGAGFLLQLFYKYANRSIIMWRFFALRGLRSQFKLSREYFLLWVINTSSMEILTLQHFRMVQTKQRLINRYITNETWLNQNCRVTRLSVTLLKMFQR